MQVKGTPANHESTATPRQQALAALTRWRAERPWARVDPATLDIHDVQAVGPTQVILTSTFERRGVEYEIVHANTAPDVQDPGPDPWSVPLQHPEGLPLGSRCVRVCRARRCTWTAGCARAWERRSAPPATATDKCSTANARPGAARATDAARCGATAATARAA
jgi:hypothetical protein